jgi:hypothetical protein
MEVEHAYTEGPWRVTDRSELDRNGRVRSKIEPSPERLKNVGRIAHVYAKDTLREQEANASLIAAAPTILECLREVDAFGHIIHDGLKRIPSEHEVARTYAVDCLNYLQDQARKAIREAEQLHSA